MSDPVLITLIVSISGFFTTALGLLNTYILRRNTHLLRKTGDDVAMLEKNTNSIKDALMKATGDIAFAQGVKVGKDAATDAEKEKRK